MATQWHYARGGQRLGPVAGAELKQLAASGRLGPDDLVWKEGMAEWVPARRVRGLVPEAAPPRSRASSRASAGAAAAVRRPARYRGTAARARTRRGFHPQRLTIVVAAGLGMLGTFVPWFYIFGVAVSGTRTEVDPWITLALFVPAAVLAFVGAKNEPLRGGMRLGAVLPAAASGAFALYRILDVQSALTAAGGEIEDEQAAALLATLVDIGPGLYMIVFAAVALLAAAWGLTRA